MTGRGPAAVSWWRVKGLDGHQRHLVAVEAGARGPGSERMPNTDQDGCDHVTRGKENAPSMEQNPNSF